MDTSGQTPLLVAAGQGGRVAAVAALLADPRVNVSLTDKNRQTALHAAVEYNRTGVVEVLLAHKGVDPNGKGYMGIRALHLSVVKAIIIYECYKKVAQTDRQEYEF